MSALHFFFGGRGLGGGGRNGEEGEDPLLTCFLSVWVEDVDVHRSVQTLSNGLHLSLLELVVAADGLRRPVAPVQKVLLADMGSKVRNNTDYSSQRAQAGSINLLINVASR